MNDEKFNKALLDLVVKTANDLSKHHADLTLDLISGELESRLGEQGKSITDIADLIASLGCVQSGQRDSIDQLVDKLADTHITLNEAIDETNTLTNENITAIHNDIERVKDAYVELAEIVDSKENINALADAIKDLDNKVHNDSNVTADEFEHVARDFGNVKSDISKVATAHDGLVASVDKNTNALADGLKELETNRQNDAKLHKDLVESFINDVTKVNEALVRITDDVTGNDEALQERIRKLSDHITESVENITKVFDIHQATHDEAMTDVLEEVAGFDEKVEKLKTSLIGYGDDLATLSKDLHTKIITLRDCKVDHDGQLDKLHASVAKFEDDNVENIRGVEKLATALSEQFSELKNESFLSADKIDAKFAEIRLSLVETDLRRTEELKNIIAKFGDNVSSDIEEQFKAYQNDMDERITGDTRGLIDSVDKMLATDKQLLARAKHWQSGVEYGPSVIVRNLGGVWQSRAATCDEPTVESADWYCLSSSFHKTSIIKQHHNGVETVIGIHDSLGNVHELSIPVPTIRYLKGVYDPVATYDHLDSIMKDGCRWVATKDEPEGVPGEDDADWQVLTMRGPKGFKGATGTRGPKGDTGEKGGQGKPGSKGAQGPVGPPGRVKILKSDVEINNNKIARSAIDMLVDDPEDGEHVIIYSTSALGEDVYLSCTYVAGTDKWLLDTLNAV